MLEFLNAIHRSLVLDSLGQHYMSSIGRLLKANCYGFYLFEPTGEPARVAVLGGVRRFVRCYEEDGYRHDPLLRYLGEQRRPICESQLFSESEWQHQPLRRSLTMRHLAHMLEAPIYCEDGTRGVLFFTRHPAEKPFGDADVRTALTVSVQVATAVHNTVMFRESQESRRMALGALEVIGAAVVLSDSLGNIRFVNGHAEDLLSSGGDAGPRSKCLRGAIHDNVVQLSMSGIRSAVNVVPTASTNGPSDGSFLLHSVRIPGEDCTVATFVCAQRRRAADVVHLSGILSPRELEVLQLVTEGSSNKEIAQRLVISIDTVKFHLKQLFRKLHISSRAELLAKVFAYRCDDEGVTANPLPSLQK